MKEEMTSFDIAVLTPELDRIVSGARVNNIYQTNPTTVLLKLRQPGKPYLHLLIEAGRRLHLTGYTLEAIEKPPSFCMALRKYLRNGTVQSIQQHEFERVVTIHVRTRRGDYQLVTELFGKGNIILIEPENTILHALSYRRMRDRSILRGERFQHAPPQGLKRQRRERSSLNQVQLLGKLEVVKALTKLLDIGGLYAEEILLRAGVPKDTPCDTLTATEIERILEETKQLLAIGKGPNLESCIVIDDKGTWIDVTPIPLQRYTGFKLKAYRSFNKALDEYYTKTVVEATTAKASKIAQAELGKQERILRKQEKALKDSAKAIEENRKIGDTIYSHLNELRTRLQEISERRKAGKSWEKAISEMNEKEKPKGLKPIHFSPLQTDPKNLTVTVNGLTFPLSTQHTVQRSASNYYMKAKKAKRKLEGTKKAIAETQTKIAELKQQRIKLTKERSYKPPPTRRKKAWFEKFRWFYSSDGSLVLGGRDATTNELLIKKHMETKDIVFHADIRGAPFVLVKTDGKPPSKQTLIESAQLAAAYSRAWKEMLRTISVYWVFPHQIKKDAKTLARGAFIIQGPKNYIRNVPLQTAIGIQTQEEHSIIIGGPAEAISQHADTYLEIIPGNRKSQELAETLRGVLANRLSEPSRTQILETPLEEIQRFIPLGRGAVKPQISENIKRQQLREKMSPASRRT